MSAWRKDFPALRDAYLDTAATAHKPQVVIDRISELLGQDYATVSRGIYRASQNMTAQFERARHIIARFIKAQENEIVFTKNATESLTLVANAWGRAHLGPHDRVLLTRMEHHANIVPWQILQKEKGFAIDVLPLTEDGDLDLAQLEQFVTKDTKLLSFVAVSNVLGTVNPVKDIVAKARQLNPAITICVDASQAAPHGRIDVADWDCDFLAFTGHKLYGPTGIGILYGKTDILNAMPPFLGGGDMIDTVDFEDTIFRDAPHRFEAGTPPFVETIALATAIDYLDGIGWDAIEAQEKTIAEKLFSMLSSLDFVTLTAKPKHRIGIAPFTVAGCHASDVGMILDEMGVSLRVGHHCAMPLLKSMGHSALLRASIGLYSNEADIALLEVALHKAKRMLG